MRSSDLTRVPGQIRLLSRLFRIDLIRTEIQSIEIGAFNAANSSNYRICMDFSKITAIAPGAFSGYYGNGSIIILDNNNVTRFESAVFQPVLEQMVTFFDPTTGFNRVRIDYSNKIKCYITSCCCIKLKRVLT